MADPEMSDAAPYAIDVTIGICCYNAEATLKQAIISALSQTGLIFEIIIVDDSSTDHTYEMACAMAREATVPICVYKNEKNSGVAVSRNKIIEHAHGEFVAFFDDDDISLPHRIETQRKRIMICDGGDSTKLVVCHTARMQSYPDGSKAYARTMGALNNPPYQHGQEMAAHLLFNKPVKGGDHGAMATCSQMARRSTYLFVGGFDEAFRRSEDTELNIRLALAGGYFVGIDEAMVIQTMTMSGEKALREERMYAQKIYEKHRAFLEAQGRGNFDREWLDIKHDYYETTRLYFFRNLLKLFLRHPLLSMQRMLHALPNIGSNLIYKKWHQTGGTHHA